jgi:DNA-directed RNA polymerase subunit omega
MARITIEDSLKFVDNRFLLVHLITQRAKQLLAGATPVTTELDNKAIVTALREAELGKLRTMTADEIEAEEAAKRAKAAEVAAKAAAMQQAALSAGDALFSGAAQSDNSASAKPAKAADDEDDGEPNPAQNGTAA